MPTKENKMLGGVEQHCSTGRDSTSIVDGWINSRSNSVRPSCEGSRPLWRIESSLHSGFSDHILIGGKMYKWWWWMLDELVDRGGRVLHVSVPGTGP